MMFELLLVASCVLSLCISQCIGIPYTAKGPEYPLSNEIPLGYEGLQTAFSQWYSVPFTSDEGPYLKAEVNDLAVGNLKSVSKLVKEKIYFENITFFNMVPLTAQTIDQAGAKYRYADDELDAERVWGTFGIQHDMFTANVSFTRASDDQFVTCPAVGTAKIVYVKSPNGGDEVDSCQYTDYDVTVINKPFKYIGLNKWRASEVKKQVEYLTFIDPSCAGFENAETDTSKLTSSIDRKLGGAPILRLTGRAMKKHYEKWVIEPKRMKLIGATRMANSQEDTPDEEMDQYPAAFFGSWVVGQ